MQAEGVEENFLIENHDGDLNIIRDVVTNKTYNTSLYITY